MKAKYINNRPASFGKPEEISIGDIIEQNNPPRGVNYWRVKNILKSDIRIEYTVEMLQGSAFTGSIYIISYVFKYPDKKLPTNWFFEKIISLNN